MTTFTKVNVTVWPEVGWRVQWRLTGDAIAGDWTVRIYRASGPEGPFTLVGTKNAITDAVYEDRVLAYRSFYDKVYYKLAVHDSLDVLVKESLARTTGEEVDIIAKEIIRQHELLLYGTNSHHGYYGKYLACFKRTIQGTPCIYCRDSETGQRIKSRCMVCLGTGVIEGWTNPIRFRGRFMGGETKQTVVGPLGESDEESETMFMAAYPELEPGDVLAERDHGDRYRVQAVECSRPGGILVSQRARISKIMTEDITNSLNYPGDT